MPIIDDVTVLLGRDLTPLEEWRAARLIQIATAAIASAMPGLTITPGTETATIYPFDATVVWTPKYPVTAITEIGVDGNPVTGYAWNDHGRIDFAAIAPVNEWELHLPLTVTIPVTVTYDYGFTDLPADVSGAIAAAAADVLRTQASNPDLVQSEGLGAYQVAYGSARIAAAATGVAVPLLAKSWARNRMASIALVAR